jgi:phosphoglycolate phosphatase
MYQTVIFDLDGTLLYTLEDLSAAVNHALAAHGYPQREQAEVRRFLGRGIRNLMERSVPEGVEGEAFEAAFATFREYYQLHSQDHTRPYEGIPELLDTLGRKKVRCAIVSNKVDSAVQPLCRRYFDGQVALAVGERPGVRRKPAPDAVEAALSELGADKSGAVYVGDSEVDYQTAVNAGLPCILVSWGYRDRPELEALGAPVADTPAELLELLRS